jgi:flagellar hook protein FlgE
MSLIGTLGSGVSALRTFMKGLEVIGANIANVNTTGYKSAEAIYADSFSNILQRSSPSTAGASNTPSTGIGTGVVLAGVNTNFSQGSLASTGKDTLIRDRLVPSFSTTEELRQIRALPPREW